MSLCRIFQDLAQEVGRDRSVHAVIPEVKLRYAGISPSQLSLMHRKLGGGAPVLKKEQTEERKAQSEILCKPMEGILAKKVEEVTVSSLPVSSLCCTVTGTYSPANTQRIMKVT